jgi:hypothetical protein
VLTTPSRLTVLVAAVVILFVQGIVLDRLGLGLPAPGPKATTRTRRLNHGRHSAAPTCIVMPRAIGPRVQHKPRRGLRDGMWAEGGRTRVAR